MNEVGILTSWPSSRRAYVSMFLIAFATLMFEVTLARLLSVVTWYHLAFFAISVAMLGMTAGATTVYLLQNRFSEDRVDRSVAWSCLAFALAVPGSITLLCLLPLGIVPSLMTFLAYAVASVASLAPFYFSGIAITALLTRTRAPVNRIYAADLVGASLGCVCVLAGLSFLDAPSVALLCAATGVLAGRLVLPSSRGKKLARACSIVTILLTLGALLNSTSSGTMRIRPLMAKGMVLEDVLLDRWNSLSMVAVHEKKTGSPQMWGRSPVTPTTEVESHRLKIDGAAGTRLGRFQSRADIEHLAFDVTNVAYHLRTGGRACVIGVGGGRDVQSALLFDHQRVVGVEVNPIFIDLLQGEFADFAGLASNPSVELVTAEARSYLTRTEEEFDVVQMSLIDTWASTSAGAFSLSENVLYTIEAWQIFLDRLAANGIFTVSRWYHPEELGETGRLLSLAQASLLAHGVDDPRRHMFLIGSGRIATLLLSAAPFSSSEIQTLSRLCEHYRYTVLASPDDLPSHRILRAILLTRTIDGLARIGRDGPLRIDPPTDEDPYFFNQLRLGRGSIGDRRESGVLKGNSVATLTLLTLVIALGLLSVVTVVLPLALRKVPDTGSLPESGSSRGRGFFWGALYFSLIGSGFMLLEIALIQRLTLFLGHPTYALGILLSTLIASTGIGSLLFERLPLRTLPGALVPPAVCALAILVMRPTVPAVIESWITSSLATRVALSVAVLAPVGLLLGRFFPAGMQLVREGQNDATPWYWALNGIFGVLCSALAVFISIHIGVSWNFYLSAACYAACLAPIFFLTRSRVVDG